MLTVKEIYKEYDALPLLNGLSFEVAQGELVCLLGSSGSGKSTMLRIIAGLEEPASGRIFWDGQEITHLPAHQRGFGLMFQDYALFPHKSVAENIAFGLRMANTPKEEIDQIVRQSLESIRMLSFADRPVTELSGGEQQRVALARALAPDPRLLMLDEPLGALDHNLRTELINELRQRLRASQKPVIYVTHDQEEAFALADRLLLLHEGRLIQEGSTEEVFRRPANAWVASFLGLGNLIPAARAKNGQIETKIGTLALPTSSCPETLHQGEQFSLLIRPEDAQLGLPAQENALSIQAQVLDCIFFRDYFRIEVTIKDQSLIIYSQQAFQPGKEIFVHWSEEDILCLPN